MDNLRAKLQDILDKKESGRLNKQDIEDYSKILREIKRSDYMSYCSAIRPKFNWAWFQRYIQERINIGFTNKNNRLVCQIPYQHGKSELMGRCACSYAFGKFPEWKILYITYSDERAKEVAGDVLGLITSDEYQTIFPEVQLKDAVAEEIRTAVKRRNKLSISNFTNMNSKRGEFKAAGIDGSYNGYDANLIILDDFFSGESEASSQIVRDKRWKSFTKNILTRQQKDCLIMVMSTQMHEDDVIGRLRKYMASKPADSPDYEFIEFAAKKDERNNSYDPREIGEYLWSEERLAVYKEIESIDPIAWQTSYQNIPLGSGGAVFDATCFRWYDTPPEYFLNPNIRVVISCDPNYKKDSKAGDESAIVVIGFSADTAYLLDYSSINKVDIIDNVGRLKEFMRKYPNYYSCLIEAKGQGEDIVTLLHEEGIRRIESFDPGASSKLFRAQHMLPYMRGGQFHLPTPGLRNKDGISACNDVNRYVNEFLRFTGFNDKHDNLVDATTQTFITYGYLLEPVQLNRLSYNIKNSYGVGRGLTKLSNPLARIGQYGQKAKQSFKRV